jgi:hypothetical protein
MFCSMITGGVTEGISLPIGECKVPDGLDGPGQSPFPVEVKLIKSSRIYCQVCDTCFVKHHHPRR